MSECARSRWMNGNPRLGLGFGIPPNAESDYNEMAWKGDDDLQMRRSDLESGLHCLKPEANGSRWSGPGVRASMPLQLVLKLGSRTIRWIRSKDEVACGQNWIESLDDGLESGCIELARAAFEGLDDGLETRSLRSSSSV